MTQDIKDEALEQVHKDVLMGFDNKEEIFDGIIEMFYDEEDFDEEWLKSIIEDIYDKRQQESISWTNPSDFDRLTKAFDQLIKQKIVCLHKAGYTKQDGQVDCMEVIAELKKYNIEAKGYCFYHTQDLERAIDPEIKNLFLGFDSPVQNDTEAIFVGNKICKVLKENGFEYVWDGTIDQRIEIKNLLWQKVPTDDDFGKQRNIAIFKTLN